MSDEILHGVLCMSPELWDDTELDKQQRYSRYIQASCIIENVGRENKQLRDELEACKAKLAEYEARDKKFIDSINSALKTIAEYEARDKKFIDSINSAFKPKEKQP